MHNIISIACPFEQFRVDILFINISPNANKFFKICIFVDLKFKQQQFILEILLVNIYTERN